MQRTSPRVPPPRFPPSLQPLPPRRSLPPFLGRLRRQHFRLLAPLNSQHLGGFLPTVSQSEPDWRAASPAVPLAHPPPASRRRSKSLCRLSRSLQDHSPVLFPKPRFCSPGYPALSEVRGPRNHPQLWPFNPESPDGPCSKTRALLRCLLALLPEPSASGPRLRWIHCQSCSSGPATQRGSQERWSMADQRARTLFEWAWQHPQASRRLTHVGPRLRSEAAFAFHLRVLAHMLRVPPWVRLPLTLRWLRPDFRHELCPAPPAHMPIAFGPPPPQPLVPKRPAVSEADSERQLDLGTKARCSLCARLLQVRAHRGGDLGLCPP